MPSTVLAADTTWAHVQHQWVAFVVPLVVVFAALLLFVHGRGGDMFLAGLLGLTAGTVAGLAVWGTYAFIAGDAATRDNTDAIVAVLQDKYGATVNEGALFTQVADYRDQPSAPATIDGVALNTPDGPVVAQLVFADDSPSSVAALQTTPPGVELPLVEGEG